MNFMQLLSSLDELLYELMSWLIFYPITLWRTLRRPLLMMDYADAELGDAVEEQYTDTLSPPLFLVVSLLISHLIELALIGDSGIVKRTDKLAALVSDDTSLLLLRLLIFSLFPIVMAANLLRCQHQRLTRDTLKPPFYSQCYVTAPFALAMGLAATLSQCREAWAQLAGAALIPVALLWYGTLQSLWFAHHLRVSRLRGFAEASLAMIGALLLFGLTGPLFA
jgi:hypothetical protein